jgi:hypothetical protein
MEPDEVRSPLLKQEYCYPWGRCDPANEELMPLSQQKAVPLPPPVLQVNSKKPPHLRRKYLEPPIFSEIVKNHRFCVNSSQCALIVKLRRIDTISDNRAPLPGLRGTTNM